MALRYWSDRLLYVLFYQILICYVISRHQFVNLLSKLLVLSLKLNHRNTSLIILFLDNLHLFSQFFVALQQFTHHIDTLD